MKNLSRYSAQGMPIYENESGRRVCLIEECMEQTHGYILCKRHRLDGNDYTEYIESKRRPINEYKFNEKLECYEMSFRNSDKVAYFDSEDYGLLSQHNWHIVRDKKSGIDYVRTNIRVGGESRKTYRMHVLIMEKYYDNINIIDHKNGIGVDNRKCNLRARTQSENNMNKRVQENNTSGFVGVSWHTKQRMWNVYITVQSEVIDIGSYYYLRNAVRARIEAEDEYFGEHAFYNRDEEYRNKVQEILSLPKKTEPIIVPQPRSNTGIRGVTWDKNRDKYSVSFKGKQKRFQTLEEAISWRREMEKEHWGDAEVITTKDKEDKLI